MILAGESSVNELCDGSRFTDVVYDHDQRQLSSAVSVRPVGQVRKVQLQLLWKTRVNSPTGLDQTPHSDGTRY